MARPDVLRAFSEPEPFRSSIRGNPISRRRMGSIRASQEDVKISPDLSQKCVTKVTQSLPRVNVRTSTYCTGVPGRSQIEDTGGPL
jgi:hypothetical protein